jgi:hypothetical protein
MVRQEAFQLGAPELGAFVHQHAAGEPAIVAQHSEKHLDNAVVGGSLVGPELCDEA